MRVRTGETRQPIHEDRPLAGRLFATPFPDPEPYDNWDALHRKVTEAPLIPAMVPLGDGSTAGTSWHRVALGLDNPLIFGPADRVYDHRRTGWADAFLCHDLHPTPRRTTRHYHHQLCGSPSIAATRQTPFVAADSSASSLKMARIGSSIGLGDDGHPLCMAMHATASKRDTWLRLM
jgi:hypothetical protein